MPGENPTIELSARDTDNEHCDAAASSSLHDMLKPVSTFISKGRPLLQPARDYMAQQPALAPHEHSYSHRPFSFTGKQVFNFCYKTTKFFTGTFTYLNTLERHNYLKEHGWLFHHSATAVITAAHIRTRSALWKSIYTANPALASLLAVSYLLAYTPEHEEAYKAAWDKLSPEDFNQPTQEESDRNLVYFDSPWGVSRGIKAETLHALGPEALLFNHDFDEVYFLDKGLRAIGHTVDFVFDKITDGINITAECLLTLTVSSVADKITTTKECLLALDESYAKAWNALTPDDIVPMTQEEADAYLIQNGSPWAIKPEKLAELGPQAILLNPEYQESAFWIIGAKALAAGTQIGIEAGAAVMQTSLDAIASIPDHFEAARNELKPEDYNQFTKEQVELNLAKYGDPWGPFQGVKEEKICEMGPRALLLIQEGDEAWFWIKDARSIFNWAKSWFNEPTKQHQSTNTINTINTSLTNWQALKNLEQLAQNPPLPDTSRKESHRDILSETLTPPANDKVSQPISSSSLDRIRPPEDNIIPENSELTTQPPRLFQYVSELRDFNVHNTPYTTLEEQLWAIMPKPKNPTTHFHFDATGGTAGGLSLVASVTFDGLSLTSLALIGGAAILLTGIAMGVSWYFQRKRFKKELKRIKKQCRFVEKDMEKTQEIFNEACDALQMLLDANDDAPNKAELLEKAGKALARADNHIDTTYKKYTYIASNKHAKLDAGQTHEMSLDELEQLIKNPWLPPRIRQRLTNFLEKNRNNFVDYGDGRGPVITLTSHSIHKLHKKVRPYIKELLPGLEKMDKGMDVMLAQFGLYEMHEDLQRIAETLNQKHSDYANGIINNAELHAATSHYTDKIDEIIDKYKHLRDQLPQDHKYRGSYNEMISKSEEKRDTANTLFHYSCTLQKTNNSITAANETARQFSEAVQHYQNSQISLEELLEYANQYKNSLTATIHSHQEMLVYLAEHDENRASIQMQIAAGQKDIIQADHQVNLVTEMNAYNKRNTAFHEAFIQLSMDLKNGLVSAETYQQQFEQMAEQFNQEIMPVVTNILANPLCNDALHANLQTAGTTMPHQEDMLQHLLFNMLTNITPQMSQTEQHALFNKIADLSELITNKDKYSNVMIAMGQTALSESCLDIAIQCMTKLLDRDPENHSAYLLLLEAHLNSNTSKTDILAVIERYAPAFTNDDVQKINRFYKAKVCDDAAGLHLAFTELAQLACPEQRIHLMRDCLIQLEAVLGQYSQVAISLALPGSSNCLQTDKWLQLHVQRTLQMEHLTEEKTRLEFFQQAMNEETNPQKREVFAEKSNPSKLDLIKQQLLSHAVLQDYDAKQIAQQIYTKQTEGNRRNLELLGYGHLATDVVLTAFDQQIKSTLGLSKKQRKRVSQGIAHITSLVNLQISEKIIKEYNPGHYLRETAGLTDEQADAFVDLLKTDNKEHFLQTANHYLNRYSSAAISAKLLSIFTDVYLEHCYKKANTTLSLEHWLEQTSLEKRIDQVNTVVRHGTDIFIGTQMLLSLYLFARETNDMLSLARKTTTVFFNLPYIHQLIDSLMNSHGKQASDNRLYLFYQLLMKHFYGDNKWQQLLNLHEDSILHGVLESLQRGRYFQAAQTMADKLPIIQNTLFVIRSLHAVYQATTHLEQARIEVILSNLKRRFTKVAMMLEKAQTHDEKKAAYQKASAMYTDLKYQVRRFPVQHADLNPLYAWAIYFQHLCDDSMEIVPYQNKDTSLLQAVSHYVDQSASELARETHVYMEKNSSLFESTVQKTHASVDHLKIIALAKILKRPIYVAYLKSGLELCSEYHSNEQLSDPIFVQYDEENQSYNAIMPRGELYFEQQLQRKLASFSKHTMPKIVVPAQLISSDDSKARLAKAQEQAAMWRQSRPVSTASAEQKAAVGAWLQRNTPSFFAKKSTATTSLSDISHLPKPESRPDSFSAPTTISRPYG